MPQDPERDHVVAWDPGVLGVPEVLHAQWRSHAYPLHTHQTWTLLLVDDGAIGYALDRTRDHDAAGPAITLLPPHVPHDGHPLTADGFRKRVIYLDEHVLPAHLIGRAVDAPRVDDRELRRQVSGLDRALSGRDRPEAESRLAVVVERLVWHLSRRPEPRAPGSRRAAALLAQQARDLLDEDPVGFGTINVVADRLGVSPAHLIRTFTREFAIPPHRYVVGRRLERARRLLLAGRPAVEVAVDCGFYDQAHLSRHFRQLLDTTPGRYQGARRPQRVINDVQDIGSMRRAGSIS